MMTLRRRSLSLILLAIVTACADNVSTTGKGGNSKPDFRVRAAAGGDCLCNTPANWWGLSTIPNHIYSVVSGRVNPNAPVVDKQGNLYWIESGGGSAMYIWMKAKAPGKFFGKDFLADESKAISPQLGLTYHFDVDSQGNVYFPVQNSAIYVLPTQSGTFFGQNVDAGSIGRIAGAGAGFSGDEGPAINAQVNEPGSVAVDSAGNVFIADTLNHRIRVIAKETSTIFGINATKDYIYTVAGTGTPGNNESPAPSSSSPLDGPASVFFDSSDNLYIADSGNGSIKAITRAPVSDFFGYTTTPNFVYTIAGKKHPGMTYTGDGGPAKDALFSAYHGAVDKKGNLYIADIVGRVRFVPRACGVNWGQYMVANYIYPIAGIPLGYNVPSAGSFLGDGDLAISASLYVNVYGIALDPNDNLYIGDHGNGRIRFVPNCGDAIIPVPTPNPTLPPTPSPTPTSMNTGVSNPLFSGQGISDVEYDQDGNRFYVGYFGVYVVPKSSGYLFGRYMNKDQSYKIVGPVSNYGGVGRDDVPGNDFSAAYMRGISLDRQGNLYFVANGRILFMPRSTDIYFNRRMQQGYVYFIAGGGYRTNDGINPENTYLNDPFWIDLDNDGNIYFSESGSGVIRVIPISDTTIFDMPMKKMKVYTVAGGGSTYNDDVPAKSAEIGGGFIDVDNEGNIIFSTRERYGGTTIGAVRIIPRQTMTAFGQGTMKAGYVYSIAGPRFSQVEGDGDVGTLGPVSAQDVETDSSGNVILADWDLREVRMIARVPGNFYGRNNVLPGHIYRIAGGGTKREADVPPLSYSFFRPYGVDVSADGRILVGDTDGGSNGGLVEFTY